MHKMNSIESNFQDKGLRRDTHKLNVLSIDIVTNCSFTYQVKAKEEHSRITFKEKTNSQRRRQALVIRLICEHPGLYRQTTQTNIGFDEGNSQKHTNFKNLKKFTI